MDRQFINMSNINLSKKRKREDDSEHEISALVEKNPALKKFIETMKNTVAEKDAVIAEKYSVIAEKDAVIGSLRDDNQQLNDDNQQLNDVLQLKFINYCFFLSVCVLFVRGRVSFFLVD